MLDSSEQRQRSSGSVQSWAVRSVLEVTGLLGHLTGGVP
jgi:hypothetical protein